ncbi:MAG: SemiSWEET transporter [Candidatus Omnitrophota bacterium]
MERIYVELVGFIAGICTTLSFIPQIVKMVKTGKVRDISFSMYLVLSFGIFLWLVYGVYIKELPIIMANGVSLVLCLVILAMKMIFPLGERSRSARPDGVSSSGKEPGASR